MANCAGKPQSQPSGHAADLPGAESIIVVDTLDRPLFDDLRCEYDDYPRQPGADDYLHEAALAGNPPSGTLYDPDHAQPVRRLTSLGVHEHWNDPLSKQYSRNLGTGPGIELVPVELG